MRIYETSTNTAIGNEDASSFSETIFPDYDVRYIAINDNVDTAKAA